MCHRGVCSDNKGLSGHLPCFLSISLPFFNCVGNCRIRMRCHLMSTLMAVRLSCEDTVLHVRILMSHQWSYVVFVGESDAFGSRCYRNLYKCYHRSRGWGYNNRSQQKVSVIWQMCAVHVKVGQHGSVGGALITVKGHLAVS